MEIFRENIYNDNYTRNARFILKKKIEIKYKFLYI